MNTHIVYVLLFHTIYEYVWLIKFYIFLPELRLPATHPGFLEV